MGSSIIKYILILFVLSMTFKGQSQNVFNAAFDTNSAPNISSNVLETQNGFIFTQRADYNGLSHIQAVKIDSTGNYLLSTNIKTSSNALFYGYAGSLQRLSNGEYCQLYKIGPDSTLRLVYFNENLTVVRSKNLNLGKFTAPGLINQVNDSTILILGQVTNPGTWDLVLINTDLQGNERWRTIFGESGKDDYGFAIEYVNNKILVSGNSKDLGAHLFEFDISGSLTFDTIYTNYDFGRNVKYHPNFGLYFLVDRKNVGASQRFPVLLKLNSNYHVEWQKEYFSKEIYTYFQQLTINDQGIIAFGGGSLVNNELMGVFFQANHTGDSITSKIIDHLPGKLASFNDIRPTSDGGYIMAGQTKAPTQDSWIVKVNSWGCDNIPCIVSVAEQPVKDKGELNCYPNPSNGLGTVKGSFNNAHSSNEIKIFNSLGQLVLSKTIATKEFEMEVNLTNSGLYLVNLYEGGVLVESLKWVVR